MSSLANGVVYVDDFEKWLSERGRWLRQTPHHDSRVSNHSLLPASRLRQKPKKALMQLLLRK